mgnify:CR=1 FL=1
MGITYEADCLIGADNFIEELLCGKIWQQTQMNKMALIIGAIVIIPILGYFLYRLFRKRRKVSGKK